MGIALAELQPGGVVHDDGREGTILTKIAQGDLIPVPLPAGTLASTIGSSTASISGTSADGNPDGSMYGGTLTASSGLTQGAAFRMTAYGRILGIRYQRDAGATNAPFTVVIDGIAYAVRNVVGRRDSIAAAITDRQCLAVLVDDLPDDGPHTVEIIMASDPYGGTTKKITLYGLLAEAAKGYSRYVQSGFMSGTPTAVTTGAVALQSTSVGDLRKLFFYNTTAATRTVTLKSTTSGTPTFKVLTLAATGSAGDSAEHDFGMPVNAAAITVQADATGVNMWKLEGSPLR